MSPAPDGRSALRRRLALTVALLILAFAGPRPARAVASRDESPVLVQAGALSGLASEPIGDVAAFRYDPVAGAFVPIPFQIDERVNHAFNPGMPNEVHELVYDVFHEGDGLLDADDELAFLFADAGPQAPAGAPWVAGADATRYELAITDPRAGAPAPQRWVYLFTGTSLPRSPSTYVTWAGTAASDVGSSLWSIGFSDRWILDRYRIFAPCGSGSDLIDRVKGRAGRTLNLESEADWNSTSTFLGGLLGPVRAIRYVQGAASAINTVHHDVIYRSYWERTVNLRVHPIAAIALYVDWLPRTGTRFYTPSVTAGVPVDGVPDPSIGTGLVPWTVTSGPDGGLVVSYDVPDSPLYGSKQLYYRDDLTYNDAIAAGYNDDDDSSYGAHGVRLNDLVGTETTTIPFTLRFFPLCGGTGDATTGADDQALIDQPLNIAVTPQTQVSVPIRTVQVQRSGADVIVGWSAVPGAQAYRVYSATSASLPQASWMVRGDTMATTFVDSGAANNGTPTYYSVVTLVGGQPGPW